MLKNYFKVALRHLAKRKGFTFINVAGLAVGMACCLLIALYVQSELAYDRFHEHAGRLYRVATTVTLDEQVTEMAFTSAPVAAALQEAFPEVEGTARVHWMNQIMRHGDVQYYQDVTFVDSSFLDLFTFPLLRGDPATALDAPGSVVVTRAVAARYFGEADPMGQTLAFGPDLELRVTGVLADVPPNSHLTFEALAALSTLPVARMTSWGRFNLWTYVLLREGVPAADVAARLPAFSRDRAGDWAQFHLQPLPAIYFDSDLLMEAGPTGDRVYVYIFTAIGLFVLLVACINFTNLATARSAERAREVGVHKVLGAHRSRLVAQFLLESVLLALGAVLLALLLAELALPAFRTLAGQALPQGVLARPAVLATALGAGLVVGLLAGAYPALYLSAARPVRVLAGRARSGRAGRAVRKGLVVLQFGISVFLLVGTLVIYQQLRFAQQKRLGFNHEQLVVHRLDPEVGVSYDVLRERLLQSPDVVAVTGSSVVPGTPASPDGFDVPGKGDASQLVNTMRVAPDFAETMELELVAGRTFDPARPTDAVQAFLLNEAAVAHFGFASPEAALGQPIRRSGYDDPMGEVVGVVKDFHYASMRQAIEPLVIQGADRFNVVVVRLRSGRAAEGLAFFERTWEAVLPGYPFEPAFVDQEIQQFYENERRLATLFGYFAGLAVVIGCLGLFALAAFTAEQRTKEIGVRKVLGASVPQLAALLSKEYVGLVLAANVLAWPAAYFALDRWLDHFAYRVEIAWWAFAAAGLAALAVALATVAWQAVRAALADPVKSLRYE